MTIEQILYTTCEVFGITIEELRSKNRNAKLVDARCISIQLMAEYNVGNIQTITDSIGLAYCMYYHYTQKFNDTFKYDKHLRDKYTEIKAILESINAEPIEHLFDTEYDVNGYVTDGIDLVSAMSKEKFIILFKQAEERSKDSFCIVNCGSICLDKCEKFSKFTELIINK